MKINVTTDQGVLIEQIDIPRDTDLSKPLAKADLWIEIRDALEKARAEEIGNDTVRR